MTISRQNLPNGTIKLTITIPQKRVEKIREKELAAALKEIEVPGFRKGKAPKKLAEEKVDKQKLHQQIINALIPELYREVIQKENLKPIISPKIRLLSAENGKDWQVEIQTCEAPAVKLEKYKEEIKKVNATGKIWTPGSAKTQKKERDAETREEQLQKILDKLIQLIKVKIPELLVENELNRRLATLINKTEKLGMSLEQYLTSINQSGEQLRENYRKAAEEFWKLEFTLNKIADEERITVNNSEIQKLIQQTKDEKEKKVLESQRYFLAQMLRRQKTLDFLLSL